jgi:hypothetical protein
MKKGLLMEFEKLEWTHRERIASAALGAISTILLIATIFTLNAPFSTSAFFNIGVSLYGFALALSPKILFKQTTLRTLKSRNPISFAGTRFLTITGNTCFLIAGWFWFLENF